MKNDSSYYFSSIKKNSTSYYNLDKQILGIIIDKTFGIIYGVIFSYFIFSTIMFGLSELRLENINTWLINNSEILNTIKNYNEQYIYNILPFNEINTTIN